MYVQNLSVENGVDSDSSNKFIEFSLSQPVEDLEVYVKERDGSVVRGVTLFTWASSLLLPLRTPAGLDSTAPGCFV